MGRAAAAVGRAATLATVGLVVEEKVAAALAVAALAVAEKALG